jgi:zinc transport system substrate-binding protein
MILMMPVRPVRLAVLVATGLALTGCTAPAAEGEGRLEVLASFYPLQYVVEKVGGDLVEVGSLTPPGAEPHDVELSPRQVRAVGEADVVVFLSGFQPAVDDAVAARQPTHLLDAAATAEVAEHLGDGSDEEAGEDEHADEAADDGHDHAGQDPHFWLDPTLLAAVAGDVAAAMAEADPENADEYATGAEALQADLAALDADLTEGLAECERDVIVTAHTAFGYLTERYGLQQVGISGLEPDSEPSPARLREIRDVVEQHDVTTVFTESLVNPKVAETLAADLGLATAVLDPIESQVDEATDYRGAMEQNLTALRAALGCR